MQNPYFIHVEHPGGIEPPVSELQSLALPLGYGCSVLNYIIRSFFFQCRQQNSSKKGNGFPFPFLLLMRYVRHDASFLILWQFRVARQRKWQQRG